ncbi:MAG: RNA 2',3'-cyclic phosphodiesterase [Pseudomonadota bacterium]
MRLFVALPIPRSVAQSIMLIQGGVPGARWQTSEQLHVTLRFIGEVDGREAAMLDDALAGIAAPAFDLQLHSVGQFGHKQPHALWAGLRKSEALEHLHRKVDAAIRRVGQPQDAYKFTPHVTVARLRNPENRKMIEWLADHALFTSAEFRVGAFHMYSSRLTSDGSVYAVEREYPLEDSDGKITD